jgi:uncharacterized membrane protein
MFHFSKRFHWSGYLLGFSLGGFFDGILLHQILQWHHLLIALQQEPFRDIKVQILADGLFHALMYLVATAALWLLWRSRSELPAERADRILVANLLIGFGTWHVADALFSHWLTGIHRIKMNSTNPLIWDLGWFIAFGVLPGVVGGLMRRRSRAGTRGQVTASLVALAVTVTALWSLKPPPNVSQFMVYFGPSASPQAVMAAAAAVDARVIWADPSGELWAFDMPDPGRASALYRYGAVFISNSLFPAGCLSWSRTI